MSLLYRNGVGRNNITWGGSTGTAANYLRRTSTGRNDISFLQISTSGTWNLLERTANNINDIRWNNITFSFLSFSKYALGSLYLRLPQIYYNLKIADDRGATSSSTFTYFCSIGSAGVSSFDNISVQTRNSQDLSYFCMTIYFATEEAASGFMDEVNNNYTKVSINPVQYLQNLKWTYMRGPYQETGDKPPSSSYYTSAWYVYFNLGEHYMHGIYPTQIVFSK